MRMAGCRVWRSVGAAVLLTVAGMIPAGAAEREALPTLRPNAPRPIIAPQSRSALKGLPDLRPLTVASSYFGMCDWLDSENRFYVKVGNAGTAVAAPSKARIEFGHHVLQFAVPAIAPGKSVSVGGVYLPQEYFDANGIASLNVAVDYGNAVAESNEGNNRASCRIKLRNVLRGMEPAPSQGTTPGVPRGLAPDSN